MSSRSGGSDKSFARGVVGVFSGGLGTMPQMFSPLFVLFLLLYGVRAGSSGLVQGP